MRPKCFAKVNLTVSRKGHVGQNRTNVDFQNKNKVHRTNITAIEHTLACQLQFHLYITVIHSSLCKVETVIELLKCVSSSFPEQSERESESNSDHGKRHVPKRILVTEIEIILWCLIFSNLSIHVHLHYHRQIKSIHVFKRIILVKLVLLWKCKLKTRKLLSSHVLLFSLLLRLNRTTLQAQAYQVFNHKNWLIKMRHSDWLCSKAVLTVTVYLIYSQFSFCLKQVAYCTEMDLLIM